MKAKTMDSTPNVEQSLKHYGMREIKVPKSFDGRQIQFKPKFEIVKTILLAVGAALLYGFVFARFPQLYHSLFMGEMNFAQKLLRPLFNMSVVVGVAFLYGTFVSCILKPTVEDAIKSIKTLPTQKIGRKE